MGLRKHQVLHVRVHVQVTATPPPTQFPSNVLVRAAADGPEAWVPHHLARIKFLVHGFTALA